LLFIRILFWKTFVIVQLLTEESGSLEFGVNVWADGVVMDDIASSC